MAPSPSERLLVALLKADTSATASLSSFLAASHTSHAALSAYASAHQAPLGDVLRAVEASLRGVHEAVRSYVGAMEMWTGELAEVKDREEEVGQVRRDRDILVTRLIKASKLRPASTHGPLSLLSSSSPHSSVLSLPSPSDQPKLAHAQAELQACEQHLAQRQKDLEEVTKAAVARGVMRRCAALDELAEACRTATGRARGSLGALVPAKYQNGTGNNAYEKPLPNPSPYTHRPPPRAVSPSTDSLSPSQSASQIAQFTGPGSGPAHQSAPHLPGMYGFPDQAMGGRQSAETYRPGQAEQRLSLVVPPAHAISATFIPDSRLLPLRERAGTPTQHQMQLQHQQQQQQQLQMQQQEQQRQQQQQQQPRPQSRQQIQPPPEDDGSDSEDHGALIVHENAPRNSMSFPTSTPPPQHPHPHPQHRQQHPHAHPHQPQTPVRTRTVSSSTPSRRQSKHIPLPSTQSDLGPRGPPPAVQISGSPLTGSLPRPRPSAYGTQRRPSSQSLDSYELPTRQNKKRGFFGTIAHALHLGGGGRDGRESPPFGDRSGSGWGKKDRSGGGGGWNTRTDRRIRDMHGWRGESSDEDVSALVTVENPRAAGGARPALDQRWGSESPHASGGGDGRRKAPPAGLTRGASVANGSGSTPTRSPSQRRVVEQQRALSPQEVLESRLDAAARTRTMSTPGAGAGAGIGAGVGVGGMPGGGARQQEGFTRLRTISEASGTGNRRSVHESAGAGAGTPGRAGGQHAAGLARSGTGRSAMSTATAPPGGASAPGAALSRSGTTRSSMSAPPNSAPGAAGAKKKPLPSASASARQQHRMSGAPSGGPNILSVLDENEGGAGGGGGVGKGLVEIKAPPRVLRDPADGLISVKAPAPATTMLPLSGPPAPAPQSAQPTKAQQTPRPNGASSLARNLSTSTSASTAHGHTAAANNNLSRNLSTSTSASSAHVRPQRAQPPPATTLHPSSALAASASGATAGSHSSGSSTGVGGQYVHHTPVPSARAPMPIKSALRTRSPSPEPPRPIIALPPPAPIAQQPPAPAPAAPMSPATPVATAAALPTEAQPRPQPPDGLKPRPASAATFGTSGDDASAYETGLEEMEDSGSESAYSGTPGQGTPRLGTVPLEEEQSTPIAVRAMPPFVPSPVVPPAPQPVTQQGENDSGVSESTAVASDKPTRRKSVRLDVPPSLTPTPAAEDFPEDPWKVSMDELANAKPSRSYLSTPPAPAKSSSTHGSQPSPQRGFQLHDRPPPPEKGPALDGEDPEDGGWHMRASSGDSSDEEDGEYARAKRELEEANKRYAQAGHLRRR